MKKTLRMGDLLHMDAGVPQAAGDHRRVQKPDDGAHLRPEACLGGRDVGLVPALRPGVRPYFCNVGDYLAKADDAGKKILFEAQLGALRDIDFGIYPTLPAPTPSAPMRPSARASPAASWTCLSAS